MLLAIVFLLELSAGLAGYVLQDGLKEYLVNKVNISMEQYSTDPEIAETIDFMQERVCYTNTQEKTCLVIYVDQFGEISEIQPY